MFSNLNTQAHLSSVSTGRNGIEISMVLLADGFHVTPPSQPTREIFVLVSVFTAPMTTVDWQTRVWVPYTTPVSGRYVYLCGLIKRSEMNEQALFSVRESHPVLPKISIDGVVLVVPRFGFVNCLTINVHPTPYNNYMYYNMADVIQEMTADSQPARYSCNLYYLPQPQKFHLPICRSLSSNIGTILPSAVGPTFIRRLPPQLQ